MAWVKNENGADSTDALDPLFLFPPLWPDSRRPFGTPHRGDTAVFG